MKTIIFLLLISFELFAQNLGNVKDLAISQNGKCWNGLQVNDTLLAKGLLYFPSGATNNYVLTTNAAGIATWTNPTTIAGAWTKSGTTIYPTTITDNVGIGKVPAYPFDFFVKSGADSLNVIMSLDGFQAIGWNSSGETVNFTINPSGTITIIASDNALVEMSSGIVDINSQFAFSQDSAMFDEKLRVADNVFCDTLFGVVSGTITSAYSSTYTPSLTNVTNVAASTAYVTGYYRVGTSVTVYGKVNIDATLSASADTELGISLPVASNLAAEEDLGGNAISDAIASLTARIKADATNNRASVVFKAISLNNDAYSFEFSYQVK